MKRRSIKRVYLGAAVVFVAVLLGACTNGGSTGSTSSTSGGSAAASPSANLFYGEDGPHAPGSPPAHCPPPLTGMLRDFPQGAQQFKIWRDDLGGKKCFGSGGAYDSCGDGYGDEYMGYPPEDSGACIDQRVSGLPYSLTVEQRTADATSVVGGECFTHIDRDKLTLSDCRLPHIGRITWGRSTDSDPKVDLKEICDINKSTWDGFGAARLIQTKTAFACVSLRTDES